MSFLGIPKDGPRRKSTSDLFKGMTVTKALAVLKMTDREYKELSDEGFREAFTRKQEVEDGPGVIVGPEKDRKFEKKGKRTKKASLDGRHLSRCLPPTPQDQKKVMERSIRVHEAFQFLVKRRAGERARLLDQDTPRTVSSEDLSRTVSPQSCQDPWGSESSSPLAKRRASVYDPLLYPIGLVGPGTPPPIEICRREQKQELEQEQEQNQEQWSEAGAPAPLVGIRKVTVASKTR